MQGLTLSVQLATLPKSDRPPLVIPTNGRDLQFSPCSGTLLAFASIPLRTSRLSPGVSVRAIERMWGNPLRSERQRGKGIRLGRAYAAYIHPSQADSGAYGGMSFVIFALNDGPCLVAKVSG